MTPLLGDLELADVRADLDATLSGSGVVTRRAKVSQPGGGWTETWTTVATVPLDVRALSAIERQVAGTLNIIASVAVDVPALTNVKDGDRIMTLGRTFQVEYVPLETAPLQLGLLASVVG